MVDDSEGLAALRDAGANDLRWYALATELSKKSFHRIYDVITAAKLVPDGPNGRLVVPPPVLKEIRRIVDKDEWRKLMIRNDALRDREMGRAPEWVLERKPPKAVVPCGWRVIAGGKR